MAAGEPISIEDLIKRKKQAEDALKKPRFIPKSQRAKLGANGANGANGSNGTKATPAVDSLTDSAPVVQDSSLDIRTNKDRDNGSGPAIKRKAKSNRFLFEWKDTEDTLDKEDDLYRFRNKQKRSAGIEKAKLEDASGIEERRRRQEALEATRKRQKMDWNDLPWSEKPLDKMTARDWRIFKDDFRIVIKGSAPLANPLRYWTESGIPPSILRVVDDLGYKEPTPIQRGAIPIALTNRDVIGIAETGSGKTASFLIPLLTYIMELPALNAVTKSDGPYAIVLAPTRELAQQIEKHATPFCKELGFRCTSIVGGHSIEEQAFNLQEGAELVIATPGRLVDVIERRILVLSQCCYVVMDEADRMIDLGFEPAVKTILDSLPASNQKPMEPTSSSLLSQRLKYRQTMMFTATWPREIEKIASQYLRDPGIVTIGNVNQATDRVEQRVEFVAGEESRLKRLVQILDKGAFDPPIIIFVNIKRMCDSVAKALKSAGWNAVTMHGSKSQEQREIALAQLRDGTADCLVATDVAGRGIDVADVSLVFNFQMAKSIDAYTHRIGRTGRAGKRGVAITFLGEEDYPLLYDLKQVIIKSEASKLSEELRRHEAAQMRPVKRIEPTGEQDDN